MSDKKTVELNLTIVVPVESDDIDLAPLMRAVESAIATTYPGAVITETPAEVE